MKISYRRSASADLVRQFRYYLVEANAPDVAVRFRNAVRRTLRLLRRSPLIGPRYSSPSTQLQNLRSWPVAGFEAVRIYYLLDEDVIHIVRILHSKRDVRGLLEGQREG